MFPLFELPPLFEAQLEKRLNSLSFSLKEPKRLADNVRKLSNLFLKGSGFGDYWKQNDMRAAYIAYFSVLNYLRARSVFEEARHRDFLKDIKSIADMGCGAGAGTWALLSEWRDAKLPHIMGVDQSEDALDEYKSWLKLLDIKSEVQKLSIQDLKKIKVDTLFMSYSLNELEDWPAIPEHVERLVIVEPSTHQAGRKLLKLRDDLITQGWYAWAPCTHQSPCPLLNNSGKDWCHHRIHWNKPEWFHDLEKFLPMRNDTLTLSYLLLSRHAPSQKLEGYARIVGDEQEEKGKSRQMICRGPYREFLSWLHRDQFSLKLYRGDIIEILHAEQRVNELRILAAPSIRKITFDKK